MTMLMPNLSPAERIDAISRRLHRRTKGRRSYSDLPSVQLAMWRHRRELLETERAQWEDAVRRFEGRVNAITMHMGTTPQTARHALWDLGLWPLCVRLNPQLARRRHGVE